MKAYARAAGSVAVWGTATRALIWPPAKTENFTAAYMKTGWAFKKRKAGKFLPVSRYANSPGAAGWGLTALITVDARGGKGIG